MEQRLIRKGEPKLPLGMRRMHAWERKGLRPARSRRFGKHACGTGVAPGFTNHADAYGKESADLEIQPPKL